MNNKQYHCPECGTVMKLFSEGEKMKSFQCPYCNSSFNVPINSTFYAVKINDKLIFVDNIETYRILSQ